MIMLSYTYLINYYFLFFTAFCQKCPNDWIQEGQQCFQLFSNKLNWHEARMACQGLGGDLAALKTKNVNVSKLFCDLFH